MRRLREERGVTMVEVVVAMLVLVIGAGAVFSLIGGASRASYRSEQSQAVSDLLQQELEKLKSQSFASLAMTATPATSSNTASPANRISGPNYALSRAKTQYAPLVINGGSLVGGGTVAGGTIPASPVTISPGTGSDVSGTLYRYVVWLNDPSCPESKCPGSQDTKRIIVAISLNGAAAGGTRLYQEVSTDVTNPTVNSNTGINPPPGDTTDWWSVHLTDTPCKFTTRQAITANHAVHNTLGSCDSVPGGLLNLVLKALLGNLFNSPPDLMFPDAQYPGGDPSATSLFNYSSDVPPNDASQKGLTMPVPTGTGANLGCLGGVVTGLTGPVAQLQPLSFLLPDDLLAPVVGTSPHTKVHKWVTPKTTAPLSLLSTATGKLNLWTKTINGLPGSGKVCVWLFRRQLDALGIPVDTPLVNLDLGSGLIYATYSRTQWPTTWTRVTVPINFALDLATLPTGSRIGIALAVDKTGTTGTGLQFLYDHPTYDSTLQLKISNSTPST
jgi:type II secretory pathway pseudopilin PulG